MIELGLGPVLERHRHAARDAVGHLRGNAEPYQTQPGDIVMTTAELLFWRFLFNISFAGHPHHSGIVFQHPDGYLALLEAGPHDSIGISLPLNGETMQDATTADLIFSIPALVAHLSRLMTLEPGDIISTGTPEGVGSVRDPRVWLQDGSNDLDNAAGNWPAANIGMADALKFKGYDYHFSFGVGEHNNAQGAAELPEALTWLWRDYDPAKASQEFLPDPAEKDQPVWRVLQLNRK